jgi:predicted metal-binding protein
VKPRGKKRVRRKVIISRFIAKLEKQIFFDGYFKAWAMGCGPCSLCREGCDEEECRHPRDARPAMEACGIDVFSTARKAGFPIDVVTRYDQRSNRFALILIE